MTAFIGVQRLPTRRAGASFVGMTTGGRCGGGGGVGDEGAGGGRNGTGGHVERTPRLLADVIFLTRSLAFGDVIHRRDVSTAGTKKRGAGCVVMATRRGRDGVGAGADGGGGGGRAVTVTAGAAAVAGVGVCNISQLHLISFGGEVGGGGGGGEDSGGGSGVVSLYGVTA